MSSNQKLHRVPFNKSEQTLTRWIKQCSLGGISCKGYSTFMISHVTGRTLKSALWHELRRCWAHVVLSPQLTPADSSSLSDYSSEPALYFWSLGPISCTVASHPWDQTAARAQPGLPHLGLSRLQLYTPAASKHIFSIRQETMFCFGIIFFFF